MSLSKKGQIVILSVKASSGLGLVFLTKHGISLSFGIVSFAAFSMQLSVKGRD